MKVGDLVVFDDEVAVILNFWCQDGAVEGETEVMAECLWRGGIIDDVDVISLEAVNETR